MEKLLTIIVPIKGSYEYVRSIIKQVINMKSELIDMVISDNTSENSELKEYIDSLNSSIINYFHHDTPISMTENFEIGIEKACGKYICILGADDNFTTRILEVVQYLNANDIESAIFNKASYNWPGMQFRVHHKTPSLTIRKFTGELKYIDVLREFNLKLANGMTSLGKLPAPYHGIIKKELFERVLLKSGRYIPGASPDMAMAVSLSLVTSKHVYIDAPITISGHSYNSAGGKGARGQHKGNLKNKSFLPLDIEEQWPSFIPKVWTSPTVYADSLVSSLIKMKEEKKLEKLNREANYATLIVFFPEYYPFIKPYIKNYKSFFKIIFYSIDLFSTRIYRFIKNYLSSNFNISSNIVYDSVENSYDAVEIIDKYLDENFTSLQYLNNIK